MVKTRQREDILLHACIGSKQPFVADNTNPTVAERAKYIELARKSSFRVVGYYVQSRFKDAVQSCRSRLFMPLSSLKFRVSVILLPKTVGFPAQNRKIPHGCASCFDMLGA
jgi:hypothetical protein